MAIAVFLDRIRRLSREDRDDLYALLLELPKADGPEEWNSIARTMREILDQTPVETLPLDERTSDGLKKWMTFVGNKVKSLREEREWTQVQLAEKSGLPQSHISRIENGVHSPTRMTLEKLARALNVDIGQLDPCGQD